MKSEEFLEYCDVSMHYELLTIENAPYFWGAGFWKVYKVIFERSSQSLEVITFIDNQCEDPNPEQVLLSISYSLSDYNKYYEHKPKEFRQERFLYLLNLNRQIHMFFKNHEYAILEDFSFMYVSNLPLDTIEMVEKKEMEYNLRIPIGEWIVLRLDGKGFSSFTKKNFKKPFDEHFHDFMKKTTMKLVEEMQVPYAFTGSDEISLLFPPSYIAYNRRIEKLLSISSGLASSTFSLLCHKSVVFDSRIISYPTEEEIFQYFCLREKDIHRCSIQTKCYWTLKNEGMSAKNAAIFLEDKVFHEKSSYLLSKNIDFSQLPHWERKGVSFRWNEYEKIGFNPIKNEKVIAKRRKIEESNNLITREEIEKLNKEND